MNVTCFDVINEKLTFLDMILLREDLFTMTMMQLNNTEDYIYNFKQTKPKRVLFSNV